MNKTMANGAATRTAKTLIFPVTVDNAETEPKPVEFSWAQRRLLELGVLLMPDTPTKPPGFYVNFSTASFLILVIGSIAGLWWFTWQKADSAGYERGRQEILMQQMNERLSKAEADEKRRKELEIYNSRQTDEKDGHAIKQKEK